MSIELTCLGGAAAWPNPGQGCSSFVVRSGQTTILLDAGPNTLLELRKHVDFHALDAIVISHCHSDHILDLIPYRYGLVYGPTKLAKRIPLWLPPGGTTVLRNLAGALSGQGENTEGFWDGVFVLNEFDPDKSLNAGSMTLRFARTAHPAVCYAMRIETVEGTTLTYTADTGTIESVLDLVRGSDILISEATMPEDAAKRGSESGHLKPSEAGVLANESGVGALVLSHLWSERPDSEVLEAAGRSFSGTTVIAKPGLVVNA
jgi:ribonuclease BN (tRNA processing enzyme)